MPVCNSCNQPSDYLQRVNPTGEKGRFYCESCVADHLAAVRELKEMDEDNLNLVEYTVVKWVCSAKGCAGHTKVRDYGIAPEYWHPRKSIHWFNVLHNFWMCSKHYKMYRRLIKNYSHESICNKLFDFNKLKINNNGNRH